MSKRDLAAEARAVDRSHGSIFTSNIGAQLGWHVFKLLRYVALPPPRVASSLYLATCLP